MEESNPILHISECLNGVFLCGTENGIDVYNTQPKHLRKIDGSKIGSVGICEILPNTKIIAVVSGGLQPRFAENIVHLYDERKQAYVSRYNVPEKVLAIRLRNNRIFIVQRSEVDVFSIGRDARKIFTIDTSPNPNGLCAVNVCPSIRRLMMLPGEIGSVVIYDLESINRFDTDPYKIFKAHSSEIVAMSTNKNGTKLATASEKGTLIRVFDTATSEKLYQFRRGTAYATIYCISFSEDSNFLCSSSDTGTIHLFSLKSPYSMTSYSTYLSWFLPAKDSFCKSFASFQVPAKVRNMCTLAANSYVYALTYEGVLYQYKFEDGVGCVKEKIENLHSLEHDRWFDADSSFQLNKPKSKILRNLLTAPEY